MCVLVFFHIAVDVQPFAETRFECCKTWILCGIITHESSQGSKTVQCWIHFPDSKELTRTTIIIKADSGPSCDYLL